MTRELPADQSPPYPSNPPVVPRTMATQHPDSAARYVAIQEEAQEAVQALTPPPLGLGIHEVMVDFEGKMTPYHQTNQIAQGLLDRGVVPGREVWITPRISSATEETAFRQLMALMSVIEATYQASQREPEAAIQEVIIPMVASAEDLVKVRDRIRDVIYLGHKEFGLPNEPDSLQLVPLVEEVPSLLRVGALLREYVAAARSQGFGVRRLRVMLGRSDAALSYGHLPSALCVRVALSEIYGAAEDLGLDPLPVYGAGYLPFRGGVMLANLDNLERDFPGLGTVTIQSGIRYDTDEAPETVRRLNELLERPAPASVRLEAEDAAFVTDCVALLTIPYLETFYRLAPVVRALSDIMPAHRDRLARKGPAGYARAGADLEKLAGLVTAPDLAERLRGAGRGTAADLPRAISFTGALYSVGLPPEFIGTGRGLRLVADRFGGEGIARLLELYPGLRFDLAWAARFLDFAAADRILPMEVTEEVRRDVEFASDMLSLDPPEPVPGYRLLLETIQPMLRILVSGEELLEEDRSLVHDWLCRLGSLRGSLG
ncbi:MAG: phosphoenolpyruvate carboxylase [Thermoleophilia bacterium]